MADGADFIVGKAVPGSPEHPNLRSGEQFKESLRDGRHVVVDGRDVEDVTTEPTLKGGIDTLAAMYDAQLDPAHADVTTSVDPDTGERIATGWLVPRSREDLRRHVAMAKFSTFQTFGEFGRPPDYGPVKAIGFLAFEHIIRKAEPEAHDKIMRFLRAGQRNNLISGDIIIDVQANRKLPMPEQAGRLRVVEERRDGIVISGSKAGNTVMAQGHMGTISMPPPNPTMPEECMIWSAVPSNAPGLTMISREALVTGTEHPEDHPLDAGGEENDSLVLFDKVFIPWEYVFSYRNPKLGEIYYVLGQFAFWKILTRMSFRAEIFAGAAQAIVNALGTDHIPAVRALVAEVIAYSAALKGIIIAAVETAKPTESGVMLPNVDYVTAGRLNAIVEYPKIMQILRELSGQGLISRVPRSTWERADIGPLLDEYLPGYNITARDKNRLFNLIWDICCSPAAMRIALFENINATPAAGLREQLYRVYDRGEGLSAVLKKAGIKE
jgi:4-hydroxyphenylacetate 3-monooxygenase